MISIRTAAEERKAQLKRQMELVKAKREALDETNDKVARLRALRLEREQAEAAAKAAAKPKAGRSTARRAAAPSRGR